MAAAQIYNMLLDYKGNVTVKIDGIAASAASVIAMAGTKVLMSPVSMLMIHNPMTVAMGDKTEMEKAIDMLASVKDSIINAYELKTGLTRAKLSHLMDAETWMDANMAVELGFADEILSRPSMTTPDEDEDDDETEITPDEDEDEEKPTKDESDEDDNADEDDEDKEEKSNAHAMLFSRKAVNASLEEKLHNHIVRTKKTKKSGRSVNELQNRLHDIKHLL